MLSPEAISIVGTITLGLVFVWAFTDGFIGSTTATAPLVASGTTTLRTGVLYGAITNFIGVMIGGSAVVITVSQLVTGLAGQDLLLVVLAATVGSVIWNLVAFRFALPTSTVHTLVGGLVGAAAACVGPNGVLWGTSELLGPQHELIGVTKVVLFLLATVLIGLFGSYLVMRSFSSLLRNARRDANRNLRRLQLLASGLLSISNGANDGQKQLGYVVLALAAASTAAVEPVPLWARVLIGVLLSSGALVGGWRIVRRLSVEIYEIRPLHGIASQATSTAALALSTLAGAPVSTNEIISTSILGAGAAEYPGLVGWSVGRQMLIGWLVTIPSTAAISAVVFWALRSLLG